MCSYYTVLPRLLSTAADLITVFKIIRPRTISAAYAALIRKFLGCSRLWTTKGSVGVGIGEEDVWDDPLSLSSFKSACFVQITKPARRDLLHPDW
jgi:hypothetical protein